MFVSIKRIAQNFWNNSDIENQESSNVSPVWNYTKTLLKGMGIVAIGGVAYTFFRGLTAASSNEIKVNTKSEKLDLNSLQSSENQSAFVKFSSVQSILTDLDIVYHSKRDSVPVTNDFLVNTYTSEEQLNPAIATLTNGDYVVTWQSFNQVSSTSNYDIYAQRFDNNGIKLGAEFLVNSYTASDQSRPAIAALANNEFLIAWYGLGESGYGIYAQRFAGDGAVLGSQISLTNSIGTTRRPAIAVLPTNEIVVIWDNLNQIFARRFADNGTLLSSEILINEEENRIIYPDVAALANGQFVMIWDNTSNIYAQGFDSNGIKLDTEFLVNPYSVIDQINFAITALVNNEFVITWGRGDIYAQRFAANGTALGNNFLVSNDISSVDNRFPNIVALSNNEFLITWARRNSLEIHDIYARRFANNGTALDDEFLVNNYITNSQPKPVSTALPNNKFVIVWQSNNQVSATSGNDIYAKIFTTGYQLPLLRNNVLMIKQGEAVRLSQNDLLANSGGGTGFDNLLFIVSGLQHGQFARVNQTILPIFNFTQAELQSSLIQFSHDDSYDLPFYQIAVSDGLNTTIPQSAVIDFYQRPQFIRNQFSIADGEAIQLSASDLLAVTYRNELAVTFNVLNVSRGVFSLNQTFFTDADVVTSFSQAQINSRQIWFVHDGSNIAPSYVVQADCYGVVSTYQLSNIVFTPSSNSSNLNPTLRTPSHDHANTIIGAVVGVTGGALLLAGLGIFGGYRYRKSKEYEKERELYPLTNALYHALKIKGVDNFTSSKGLSFVNAVDALNNELIRVGIDTSQMVPEEITMLAEKLSRAIKAQLPYQSVWGGIKLNILDIQNNAESIVQTTQTLENLVIASVNELEMASMGAKNGTNRFAQQMQQRGINVNHLTPNDLNRLADIISEALKNQADLAVRLRPSQ